MPSTSPAQSVDRALSEQGCGFESVSVSPFSASPHHPGQGFYSVNRRLLNTLYMSDLELGAGIQRWTKGILCLSSRSLCSAT